MVKKRFFGLVLTVSLFLGGALLPRTGEGNAIRASAADESLVGTPTVSWNNVDYSGNSGLCWAPDRNELGIPQEGYCLLPLYPSDIASQCYTDVNLLDGTVPGCNVGDCITINGVASKNVPGTIIYCYPSNGFFIYIPHSSVTFTTDYEFLTVEVGEGMSIDGTYQTVGTRFEFRSTLGSDGGWLVNPDPVVKKYATFEKIEWNNIDYSNNSGTTWTETNGVGAPMDGYCLLIGFREEGKSYEETVIGPLTTGGRGVLGKGYTADTMIKVNGVNIVDVEGSMCYIYPYFGLFFYIPDSSITYTEEYPIPTLELLEGIHFTDVYLPSCGFRFVSELGKANGWVQVRDPSELNHFDFRGVAEKWNNIAADATHYQSVLQFGEYGEDYLKNDQVSDDSNLVGKYSDCGCKILVNGIPLNEISGALVSYIHGYCYVYLYLPASALKASNGYKVVTLHISADTEFWDTALPEVDLYLDRGKWVSVRPETPTDGDYENACSFSDLFGVKEATLSYSDIQELNGEKACSLDRFAFYFDYRFPEAGCSFDLVLFSDGSHSALKISVLGNRVSLYECTEGEVLLGSETLDSFEENEWLSMLVYGSVTDSGLTVCIAVDDLTYVHVDNVTSAVSESKGNGFGIALTSGESIDFRNAVYGADIKKPVITYSGKAVYGVLSGSEMIDFSNKCTSYDVHDGDLSASLEYLWEDGSLSDGKINKGKWTVRVLSRDAAGNEAVLPVTVIANDRLEVTVTFDGENPVTYRIGDHVAGVPDPVREDDAAKEYRFLGWYHEDRLWDFEKDYVISDMNLESRFSETSREYCVSFRVEGLENLRHYELYFVYDTTISVSAFAQEGYVLTAYVDDQEVTSFTVRGNMSVRLVYQSTSPVSGKGCGGSLLASSSILALLSLSGVLLLLKQGKKGAKDHE